MIVLRVLRFLASKLVLLLLSFFIFSIASSWLLLSTIGSEQTVKAWLNDSGVYDSFPGTLFDLIEQETRREEGSDAVDALVNSGIVDLDVLRRITTENYGSDTLKPQAETAIEGTYAWIRSESQRPEFSVTLSETAPQYVEQMRTELTARFDALPACDDMPTEDNAFNLLTATCLPDGADIGFLIDDFLVQLADLETPIVDNEAPLTAQYTGEQLYDDVLNPDGLFIRNGYSTAQAILTMFPIAAVLTAILAFILAKGHSTGLRSIGATVFSSGFSLALSTVLLFVSRSGITSLLSSQPNQAVNTIADGFLNDFIYLVATDVGIKMAIVSAVLVGIGVLFWLGGVFLDRHNEKKALREKASVPAESSTAPQPSDQSPAPHDAQNVENAAPANAAPAADSAQRLTVADSSDAPPAAPSAEHAEQTAESSNASRDAS